MRLIIVFLLILSIHTGYSQIAAPTPYVSGAKLSYVRSWDANAPEQNIDSLKNRSVVYVKQSTQYLDGYGRPIQTVQKQISPNQKDMVMSVVYDDFGRETYKYLPYESTTTAAGTDVTNDGNFKLNAFQQQKAFSQALYPGETYYYSKTNFESSPLDKISETYAPGNSWAGTEADSIASHHHSVRVQYLTNMANDSVKVWVVNSNGTYTTSAVYTQGQLYKTVTIDEHGKQIVEFKDKEGKVLLKKVQLANTVANGHTGWLCTYYVYDIYNNLRMVIPPRAVELIATNSWSLSYTSSLISEFCFRYEYDDRNRVIVKKVPGAGPAYMVYDILDRLVMTQDSSLQAAGKWMVTEYDNLSRPLRTGLWTNASNRATHQAATGTLAKYPSASSLSSNYEILTETYYDNYDWVSGSGTSLGSALNTTNTSNSSYFYTSFGASPSFATSITQNTSTRGLVTGSKIKVLGTSSQYLYAVNFYDEKGRTIQSQSTNLSGGKDIATTQYDFSGKVLRMLVEHQKSGTNAQTHLVLSKMEYDHAGRLLKIKKTMSSTVNSITYSSAEKTIVTNQYDNAGQLKNKIVGDSTAGITEKLVNDFNIRGWLTGVNKEYIKDSINSHWFGFELGYDKTNSIISSTTYANQQYNGNISGMIWKSGGDQEKRKYDYTYDNVNRLKGASFNQRFGTDWAKTDPNNSNFTIDFSVDSMSYDANGNILFMQQKGLKLNASPVMDKMTYSYMNSGVSNKLLSVTEDGSIGTVDNKLGDFTDRNTSNDDYTYDGNGNLIADKNKRIDSIYYNHLNLPRRIRVSDSSNQLKGIIEYTYDAIGNKLEKKTTEGSVITTTSYIGGFVYQNDTLQFAGHEEGRVRFAKKYFLAGDSTYALFYDYFLKDHLGNVRTVLTEQRDTANYRASFETASNEKEKALFVNIDETRCEIKNVTDYPTDDVTTDPNAYTSKLDGDNIKLGAAITLKVMAGDTIDLGVKVWYPQLLFPISLGGPTPQDLFGSLLASLSNQAAGLSQGKESPGDLISSGGPIYPGLQDFLDSHTDVDDGSKPLAYLNWVLLDEQFKYVPEGSGFMRAPNQDADIQTMANNGITIPKSGYLFIYLSNETVTDVYFDNLSILYYTGPLVEETHYYPFGLTMAGISSKAAGRMQNKKLYIGKELQSQEFSDGSGLEMYDFGARFYDSQIGRWGTIDPKADQYRKWSPYNYCVDNPLRFIDPDGMSVAGPGDRFKSIDDAAKDFAKTYNDNSIMDKKEYATTIYKIKTTDGKTSYSYSEPNKGSDSKSTNSGTGWSRTDVAHAHTHSNYDPKYDNNNFSKTDTDNAKDNNYPNYVATPNGSLKRYDPATGNTTTVATDIPSDPKDPTRVNTIDPVSLPKNEPTRTFGNFVRDNFVIPFLGTLRTSGPIIPKGLIL